MEYKDYYAILGVDRKADQKQIKAAYRKLARKYHPDQSKERDAAARFKEISEAYEVLGNPDKRAKYDEIPKDWNEAFGFHRADGGFRHAGPWGRGQNGSQGVRFTFGGEGADGFSEFFRMFFSGETEGPFGGRDVFGARRSAYRGADLEGTVEITLWEAFHGTEKTLSFNGQTFRLRVPPGTEDGTRIRVPSGGQPGAYGGSAGDFYVHIRVRPHHFFALKGRDLECTLPVTVPEAALGAKVEFPYLKGMVSVNIPPGSQNGTILRLKRLGLPGADGKPPGNLLVRLEIRIPERPTAEEKELFEKLRHVSRFNPRTGLVV
ncbi:MAG: DnaJ C-terminal domain-containing protein [Bacillota bacterium]